MATSGAMADFGRLPTRSKVIIFVVIGALLTFLYYRFIYKPLAANRDKAKAAHVAAVGQNNQMEGDIPKFQKLLAKKKILDATITDQERALPTEAEVPAFFETLSRKISESGAELVRWSSPNEDAVESFVRVKFDFELTGTFMQLKRFFASLVEKKKKPATPGQPPGTEERERIVSVENLVLSQPTIRNGAILLTAKFTAVTFRQGDPKPVAPVTPGATPANAPAPSAPGTQGTAPAGSTAPPPLPSASTPQGAKARVEDSMKKSEERVRDTTQDPVGSAAPKGGQ